MKIPAGLPYCLDRIEFNPDQGKSEIPIRTSLTRLHIIHFANSQLLVILLSRKLFYSDFFGCGAEQCNAIIKLSDGFLYQDRACPHGRVSTDILFLIRMQLKVSFKSHLSELPQQPPALVLKQLPRKTSGQILHQIARCLQ